MGYADDLVLLSPTPFGTQKLLSICSEYAKLHDLIFNSDKSVCMFFNVGFLNVNNPSQVFLNDLPLNYVDGCKYLGCIISNNGKADLDIKRQLRKFYANANNLLRNFSKCSYDVKCELFRSFCCNLYCSQFWIKFTKLNLQKFIVSYNNGLRRLLSLPRCNSASEMFACLNIPSFGEMQRKYINSFLNRLNNSQNVLLHQFAVFSPVKQYWYEKLCLF